LAAALTVVVGALCIFTIEVRAGDATLSVLAAGRFHDLTVAERRLLEYADIGNEKRGEWAFCGIRRHPRIRVTIRKMRPRGSMSATSARR
jgi:hypothetical protein